MCIILFCKYWFICFICNFVLSNIVFLIVVKELKYRYYNNIVINFIIVCFYCLKSVDVMVLRLFDKYLVDIINIVVEEVLLIDI